MPAAFPARLVIAALLALGLGWVVLATTQNAFAESGETVTTELQPGFNVAGWTQAEADVDAIFDDIPRLGFLYAWDAERQRFRLAVRADTGVQGDLATLTPGMGLRLWLAGDGPYTWTRPLIPHTGAVSVYRGWNLVVWAGEDGVATTDALQPIAGIVTQATDGGGTELSALTRGGVFWLKASAAARWWQAGGAPRVEFASEFSPVEREDLQANLDDVVWYFARQYGLVPPGVVVRFGDDFIDACGHYAHPAIVLRSSCAGALAHEYAHALQHAIATKGGQSPSGRWWPAWLGEGGANHWSARYFAWQSGVGGLVDLTSPPYIGAVQRAGRPLSEMETYDGLLGWGGSYSVAQFAVDWLASLVGPEAMYAYYAQRYRYQSWQDAIEALTGVSVSAFYEGFEKHRRAVAPPFPEVEGLVVGQDGTHQEDVTVVARDAATGKVTRRWSDEEGRVVLPLEPGSYFLSLLLDECPLEWSSADQRLETVEEQGVRLTVGEAGIAGMELTLATAPSILCGTLSGVVHGPDGELRKGVTLRVRSEAEQQPRSRVTSGTGKFEWILPRGGAYELSLSLDRCPLAWSAVDSTLGSSDGRTSPVSLEKGDFKDLVLRVSATGETCPAVSGVVQGPDGEPQRGVTVRIKSKATGVLWYRTTSRKGNFGLTLEPGAYEVSLLRNSCPLDWTSRDAHFQAVDSRSARLVLSSEGITGAVLRLPGPATELCPSFEGVIEGPGGEPQEGVAVRIQDEAKGGFRYATTNSEGKFAAALETGSHEVALRLGACPLEWSSKDAHFEAVDARSARLVLSSEGITGVVLRLPGNARELCPRFEGVVVGPHGAPQEGVTVGFRIQATSGSRYRTTNSEGSFGISLERGTYEIVVFRSWCPLDWSSRDAYFEALDARSARLVVSGEAITGVVLTLPRAASEQCPAFKGLVVGPEGAPQEGVTVRVKNEATGGSSTRTTNSEGTFALALERGTYEIAVFRNWCPLNWSSRDAYFEALDARSGRLVVSGEAITGVVLTLPRAASEQCPAFEGLVVGPEGAPQEGVTVRVKNEATGGFRTRTTNSEGIFALALERGTYEVSVVRDACSLEWSSSDSRLETVDARKARVVVSGDEITGVVLAIPAGAAERCGTFQGVVVGPDGSPQEGVRIRIRDESTGGSRYRTTSSEGTFAMTLEQGTYEVSLSLSRCLLDWTTSDARFVAVDPPSMRLMVSSDDNSSVVLTLPEPATEQCLRFEGVVLGPGGEPQEGVSVSLMRTSGSGGAARRTGADGTFDMTVSAGTYDLTLRADPCSIDWSSSDSRLAFPERRPARVVLDSGDVTGVVLTLPAPVGELCPTIAGAVTDLAGRPRAGVLVTLAGTRRATASSVEHISHTLLTGADGTFSKRVPRGTYRISIRVGGLVGYYGGDHGFVTSVAQATAINVVTSDVTGIVVPYGFISGTVKSLDGQPVFGARVGFNPVGSWQVLATGDGSFRLPVPRGAHRLVVKCRQGGPVWYRSQGGHTLRAEEAAYIAVGSSDRAGFDIVVPARQFDITLRGCPSLPDLTKGVVVGPDGSPRRGLRLKLTHLDARHIISDERHTTTSTTGSFLLEELTTPDYLYLRLRPRDTCIPGLAEDGDWIPIGRSHGKGRFVIASDLPHGMSVEAPHAERIVIRIPDHCSRPPVTLPPLQ